MRRKAHQVDPIGTQQKFAARQSSVAWIFSINLAEIVRPDGTPVRNAALDLVSLLRVTNR